MRFNKFHSIITYPIFCIAILLLLTACSNINNVTSGVEKSDTSKKSTKKFEHTHASNPCTKIVTHTHIYKDINHRHRYECEETNEYVKNAHIHPAVGKYPRRRHVHPNGASIHFHHRK